MSTIREKLERVKPPSPRPWNPAELATLLDAQRAAARRVIERQTDLRERVHAFDPVDLPLSRFEAECLLRTIAVANDARVLPEDGRTRDWIGDRLRRLLGLEHLGLDAYAVRAADMLEAQREDAERGR